MVQRPIYPDRLIVFLVDEDIGISNIRVIYAFPVSFRKCVVSRLELEELQMDEYTCSPAERRLTRRLYSSMSQYLVRPSGINFLFTSQRLPGPGIHSYTSNQAGSFQGIIT